MPDFDDNDDNRNSHSGQHQDVPENDKNEEEEENDSTWFSSSSNIRRRRNKRKLNSTSMNISALQSAFRPLDTTMASSLAATPTTPSDLLWVDKYAPTTVVRVIKLLYSIY
ncbi:hypothetical protein BDF19DRAFT_91494 [Syncephalis fuscata]|nr:hypothetical protein BDF19DRAFT_91494 [Syncephalis fuscata]